MTEKQKKEESFMLSHLIGYGVLAAALLIAGWLIPAQTGAVHPEVLKHSAKGEGAQTLSEFYAPADSQPNITKETAMLLDAANSIVMKPAIDRDDLAHKNNPDMLASDRYLSSSMRGKIAAENQNNPACKRLLKLATLKKNDKYMIDGYESTLILVTKLQAEGKIAPGLHDDIIAASKQANQLPQLLHAFLLLGNRLSYDQLSELVAHIEDHTVLVGLAQIAKHQTMVPQYQLTLEAFNGIAPKEKEQDFVLTQEELAGNLAMGEPSLFKMCDLNKDGVLDRSEWSEIGHIPLAYTDFPVTYAASIWSENPEAVKNYLMNYGRGGVEHLRQAMSEGKPALEYLLATQQPVKATVNLPTLHTIANFTQRAPQLALIARYLLILLGCFILMRAWHSCFPLTASSSTSVRAYRVRRWAMAAIILITLVTVSEPMLVSDAYSQEYQVAINTPPVDTTENNPNNTDNNMIAAAGNESNTLSIIFIVLFALIQAFVYYTCVTKISDVMKGPGDANLKLRLLENEDNLFDMGLYIGIGGTALTLALLILIPQMGLTVSAAYASNIFGILCVAIVKIFHVRRSREQLIHEAQS